MGAFALMAKTRTACESARVLLERNDTDGAADYSGDSISPDDARRLVEAAETFVSTLAVLQFIHSNEPLSDPGIITSGACATPEAQDVFDAEQLGRAPKQ